MKTSTIVALSLLSLASRGGAQAPNPTNLFVVDLRWSGGRLTAGKPVKLTHDEGSNSQPSFTPDGKAVVFSAIRESGSDAQSDIYRIDLGTLKETRVTRTAENENSPTVNERGEYVAVRWRPATLFKEFGPWTYAPDGTPKDGVLRGPDTTGYYTPLPGGDYALTRPKSKTFTLGLFDARSGAIADVDSGIPALPAVRIPGERALSYVRIDTVGAHHTIVRLDLATRRISSLGPALVGRTAHAWIPGRGTLLMAKGSVLYARAVRDTAWRAIAAFDSPELRNASAYVVSPKGDKLILVSQKRLGIGTVLRDSLEAGRSGAEVAAMMVAARARGQLESVDLTDNAISAVGDDRIQKKRVADGLAMHTLATTMFPSSHRAFARLGDAQMTAADSGAAVRTWRKALELNPRATEAERQAAAAVERKLWAEDIRALRQSSNAAIAAKDARIVTGMMVPDVAITGGNGGVRIGRDSAEMSFVRQFADSTFLGYTRTPTRIDVSSSQPVAAEAGNWVGRWKQPDGTRELRGTYLVMWVRAEGGWRIRSELYVTLSCTGSSTCMPVR